MYGGIIPVVTIDWEYGRRGLNVPVVIGGGWNEAIRRGIVALAHVGWEYDNRGMIIPVVMEDNWDVNMRGGVTPTTTLSVMWSTGFHGGILPTTTLSARWVTVDRAGIYVTATLGGSIDSHGIIVRTYLGGSFLITRQESVSLDNDYYLSGVRPTTPLLVKSINAISVSQVSSLNNGDAFIVDASFDALPGNAFYDAGAKAGYIGYYKRPGYPGDVVFRKPDDWETVYFMDDGKLYRYNVNRDTGARSWGEYRSMPQRALDGMQVFNAFDPDRVYDYIATIIGGYLGQLQADARQSRQIRDPDLVPRSYLPAALENIGATIDPSVGALGDAAAEQTQRYFLTVSPTLNKHAGDHLSVEGRLKVLGFDGYATVRWAKIDWPSLYIEAANVGSEYNIATDAENVVVFGFVGGSTSNTARAVVTIPPQRVNARPGNWVSMTTPGAPNKVHTFTFIDQRSVPVRANVGGGFRFKHPAAAPGVYSPSRNDFDHTIIHVNSYNEGVQPSLPVNLFGYGYSGPQESLDSLRREIDATGDFSVGPYIGVPGEQSLDTPWDYKDYELLEIPMLYWPSKFVTIHLNTLAGVPYAPGNSSERDATREMVQNSLYSDVLPVHVRIAQWATDSNAPDEQILVTETFSIA
jgi:hypothetical protein